MYTHQFEKRRSVLRKLTNNGIQGDPFNVRHSKSLNFFIFFFFFCNF